VKIGILGGTFDPIHKGHLAIALHALKNASLAKVLFVPTRQTPLKERPDILQVEHRLHMVELALEGGSDFALSRIEIERTGPSYTVETLQTLKEQLGVKAQLFFLMGWDSFMELPDWKEPEKLIQLCKLIIFNRPNRLKQELEHLDKVIPGLSTRVIMVDISPIEISSTNIRARVAQGLSIHGLVPEAVEKYIKENQLYQKRSI